MLNSLNSALSNRAACILIMNVTTPPSIQITIQKNVSFLKRIQDLMAEKFALKFENLTPDAALEGLGLDTA